MIRDVKLKDVIKTIASDKVIGSKSYHNLDRTGRDIEIGMGAWEKFKMEEESGKAISEKTNKKHRMNNYT